MRPALPELMVHPVQLDFLVHPVLQVHRVLLVHKVILVAHLDLLGAAPSTLGSSLKAPLTAQALPSADVDVLDLLTR